MNSLSRCGSCDPDPAGPWSAASGLILMGKIRMRIVSILAGVTAASLLALPVMAQDGQYAPQLTRILDEAAQGTCLEALMAPVVLNACNAQIQGMAQGLSALGAVETMTFVRAEDTPEGRVEIYSIKYAGGQTLNWFIGHEQDGKFAAVGTEG